MNRRLVIVSTLIVLVLAVPSFAQRRESKSEGSSPGSAGAGEPLPTVMLPGAVGAVPNGDQAVSGEVVLATPGEITVRTASGMEKFQLSPQTQMLAGAAEGDLVTIYYKPAPGRVKATMVGATGTKDRSGAEPTRVAAAVVWAGAPVRVR